jgi:hypothetical protein
MERRCGQSAGHFSVTAVDLDPNEWPVPCNRRYARPGIAVSGAQIDP